MAVSRATVTAQLFFRQDNQSEPIHSKIFRKILNKYLYNIPVRLIETGERPNIC